MPTCTPSNMARKGYESNLTYANPAPTEKSHPMGLFPSVVPLPAPQCNPSIEPKVPRSASLLWAKYSCWFPAIEQRPCLHMPVCVVEDFLGQFYNFQE